jgi:hypothetical protein
MAHQFVSSLIIPVTLDIPFEDFSGFIATIGPDYLVKSGVHLFPVFCFVSVSVIPGYFLIIAKYRFASNHRFY